MNDRDIGLDEFIEIKLRIILRRFRDDGRAANHILLSIPVADYPGADWSNIWKIRV